MLRLVSTMLDVVPAANRPAEPKVTATPETLASVLQFSSVLQFKFVADPPASQVAWARSALTPQLRRQAVTTGHSSRWMRGRNFM